MQETKLINVISISVIRNLCDFNKNMYFVFLCSIILLIFKVDIGSFNNDGCETDKLLLYFLSFLNFQVLAVISWRKNTLIHIFSAAFQTTGETDSNIVVEKLNWTDIGEIPNYGKVSR